MSHGECVIEINNLVMKLRYEITVICLRYKQKYFTQYIPHTEVVDVWSRLKGATRQIESKI